MSMPITTLALVAGTKACDARCPFCVSATTGYSELPSSCAINEARFAKAARLAQLGGTTTVLITGKGEPLLYPKEISRYLRLLQQWQFPLIEIQTNALRLGHLASGRHVGAITDLTLKSWHALGLNTIAISVVGVTPEHNRAVYADDYPDLGTTIQLAHDCGFAVRLCVVMLRGYVDNPDAIGEVLAFCRDNAVEQLTIRPVRGAGKTKSPPHTKYIQAHKISDRRIRRIRRWLDGSWRRRGCGTKVMTLWHGGDAMAMVYDVDGQNLALADCLTVSADSASIRTLIYYSDGRLSYDWQHQGARLL